MQHLRCTVLANSPVADSCYRLVFRYPPQYQAPNPGQFLTLRIGSGVSPLLRRPFAYSAYDATTATGELIYERRGTATRLLSAFAAGDELDLIGPLGNIFPQPTPGKRPVLVAGGIGIGPMLFLYHHLVANGHQPVLLLGARSAARLPLTCLPDHAQLCTDDGSRGFQGTVLQLLERDFATARKTIELFTCGPHGLMKAVAAWARNETDPVPCWVSMEQTMACAVGACMGCVVKIHHEKQYSRVCMDGPVYAAERIDWSH